MYIYTVRTRIYRAWSIPKKYCTCTRITGWHAAVHRLATCVGSTFTSIYLHRYALCGGHLDMLALGYPHSVAQTYLEHCLLYVNSAKTGNKYIWFRFFFKFSYLESAIYSTKWLLCIEDWTIWYVSQSYVGTECLNYSYISTQASSHFCFSRKLKNKQKPPYSKTIRYNYR